jgi:ferric-dicitrate binding protein FerR (iron transport regulator)
MSTDPLWDPSAPRDPQLEELERVLRPLAYRPDPDRLLRRLPAPTPGMERRWLAAAAALVIASGGVLGWWLKQTPAGWKMAALDGPVQAGRATVSGSGVLRTGDTLRTGASSRAKLDVGLLGEVEVAPRSEVKLLRADGHEQRLRLERGSIRAIISAPPRVFIVTTPSAVATDLGCAYKLDVDEQGHGFLRVTVGWVSFEADRRESFVPAGAACHTRKGYAPGTPFYIDAPDALQEALEVVDFGAPPADRAAARRRVLAEARARDTLTLWHLLSRGTESEHAATYDRLAQLMTIPAGVTRSGVLQLDGPMLDTLWGALDLGPTTWWRLWKRDGHGL